VLWLANLSWKLPPGFGRDDPEGLLYNFRRAEEHAVFGFLQTFMREVVIPHFTLWGAIVFTIELVAGALLTLGVFTRLGALVGTVQAVMITLLVVDAPNEWFWTYAMLILVNLVCLLTVTDERLSARPALERLRLRGRPV
jgi:thiosulfate dehydrogenase [quinone] large subunit